MRVELLGTEIGTLEEQLTEAWQVAGRVANVSAPPITSRGLICLPVRG